MSFGRLIDADGIVLLALRLGKRIRSACRPIGLQDPVEEETAERFATEIRPVVDRILPLERASEAHRVMKASEHFGKIVLQVA